MTLIPKTDCIDHGQYKTGGYQYGTTWNHAKKRSYGIHRVICALTFNRRLDDQSWVARHLCQNPRCIRAEHIIPGTTAENSADRVMHAATTRRPRPNAPDVQPVRKPPPKAILTPENVAIIRRSTKTPEYFAKKYDVTTRCIENARYGKTWTWITDTPPQRRNRKRAKADNTKWELRLPFVPKKRRS